MKQNMQDLPILKLVGIRVRTNNENEMSGNKAKIAETAGKYFAEQLAEKIKHRRHPLKTYAVYTEFDSNEHGDYTYFIGEEVTSFAEQDFSTFSQLEIPASHYCKFTTAPGQMPEVVISAWQAIWKMSPQEFNGQRSYIADFEVYDERAADLANSIVDIYVGIKA